ncbi:Ekc/keops complex subunit cgi121 [Plakobranchus ocellatus]|uniref:Ekc/keops complex subunit cgi121 n=1 Tax=Plakobranchus ocellatus TaxID=259542 RepID=A0AAV3ZUJ0_9GAST|nr:Ekc/keops complex subunit cgi121 [Plakobranchus ocellatus]
MATYKKIKHVLYPDSTITLALYSGLESCKDLRKSVMEGTVVASLLKPSMIVDPFQVLTAANKAVHLSRTNNMTTKNVHSEILFCLSPSKNISESFRSFGAADSDTSVFVAIVDDAEDKTLTRISEILGLSPVSIDDVASLADTVLITKAYKLSEEEISTYPILDALVSRIAAKEIITAGKGKN